MTYVVISLIASTLFITALALALRRHGHGQHGRPRRQDRRPARAACAQAFAVLLARRVRHQGRAVPAVLLAARQLPGRAVGGHRRVRRAAHQGRRLRDDPQPDAAVRRRQPPGDADARARRADDGGRHPRRDRPGRRQADPVVQHRQPHRLHGDGAGPVLRRRPRRGDLLHDAPHRGEDHAVPHRRPDRARRRLVAAQPARQPGPHGAGGRRAVPAAGADARRRPAAVGLRAQARARSRPASTSAST